MKIGNSWSGDSHPDDLDGMAWCVANALEASGWSLQDCIILGKSNPMSESDTGLLFESEEYECVITLAKGETYFYDAEAIKEPIPGSLVAYKHRGFISTIPWEAFGEAHFATVPATVIESCILAGTSDKGCCAHCGAPWERAIEEYDTGLREKMADGYCRPLMQTRTLGWTATCECLKPQLVPCTVLDPFSDPETTGVVALDLNRHFIGIQPAHQMSRRRLDVTIHSTRLRRS